MIITYDSALYTDNRRFVYLAAILSCMAHVAYAWCIKKKMENTRVYRLPVSFTWKKSGQYQHQDVASIEERLKAQNARLAAVESEQMKKELSQRFMKSVVRPSLTAFIPATPDDGKAGAPDFDDADEHPPTPIKHYVV